MRRVLGGMYYKTIHDVNDGFDGKTASQYRERPYLEKLCRCWNETSLCFQYYNGIAQNCRIGVQGNHGSHTPLQDDGAPVEASQCGMCETERNRK